MNCDHLLVGSSRGVDAACGHQPLPPLDFERPAAGIPLRAGPLSVAVVSTNDFGGAH